MDLISRQAGLVNDPAFFQNICDFIVGGGTLVEYCDLHDISYPACLRWLRTSVERRDLYERAQRDRDEWQTDKLLKELRDISSFDLGLIMNDDGTQKKFHEWPPVIQRAVKEIKHGEFGIEIKFFDKLKSIEMLGKQSGMFKEKIEHSGKVTLETLVSQSMTPKKDKA